MKSAVISLDQYLDEIPEERKVAFKKLRHTILKNLPEGFEERMKYGMLGYVVPHALYPDDYHCDPKLPLGFINLASQKNFIALYHLGIYGDSKLHDWFVSEFPKHTKYKLDMGKSCIRFKKTDDIPYDLIGALARKLTVSDWIACYEGMIKKKV